MDFLVADYTCLFSKGSVCAESPFRTAEQRSNRRGSPAQLSERAQPASSAPAACCEQRKAVGCAAEDRFGGVAFLASSLATQRSRPAAGARPGQRNAYNGKPLVPICDQKTGLDTRLEHKIADTPITIGFYRITRPCDLSTSYRCRITRPCSAITSCCYSITIAFYRIASPCDSSIPYRYRVTRPCTFIARPCDRIPRACNGIPRPRARSTRACDASTGGRVLISWPCDATARRRCMQ